MTPANPTPPADATKDASAGAGAGSKHESKLQHTLTWFRHGHVLSLGLAIAGQVEGGLVGDVLAKVSKTLDNPPKFVTTDCTVEDANGYHKILIIADTVTNAMMAAEAVHGTATQQMFPSSISPSTPVNSGGRIGHAK